MAGGRTNIATAGDQELQSVTAAKNMMAPVDDFPDLTLSAAATLAPTTVLARLDVPLSGLTEAEAVRRRDHFGPNAVRTHLVELVECSGASCAARCVAPAGRPRRCRSS